MIVKLAQQITNSFMQWWNRNSPHAIITIKNIYLCGLKMSNFTQSLSVGQFHIISAVLLFDI